MKICGLQKLTALDYPGKIACTVFTGGCNLRCPFCHNAALVTAVQMPEAVSQEEFFAFAQKRRGVLDGVVVTGGEPLLQPELPEFLSRLKAMGYLVKLDTNGTFPRRLASLISRGLVDYVAMDIKNSPEKYPVTCGVPEMDVSAVDGSLKLLLSGVVDYELRTTVVADFHDISDFEAMGRWVQGARRWYLQAFVDSGGLIEPGLSGVSREFLEGAKALTGKFVDYVEIRGI